MHNARISMAGIAAVAGLLCLTLKSSQVYSESAQPVLGDEDYRRAEAMLARNALPKIHNARVAPIWLPNSDIFWYRRQTQTGWEFMAVDPDKATRAIAFDHAKLATAVSQAIGRPVDAAHLPLDHLKFSDANSKIEFSAAKFTVSCGIAQLNCRAVARTAPQSDDTMVVSPDGRKAVFLRDDNLWLRTLVNGSERQLTKDGVALFAYGRYPDSDYLFAPAHRALGLLRAPPYGLDWSPDSRLVVATRVDERMLAEYGYLQYLHENGNRRPTPMPIHVSLSGDKNRAIVEISIIDTDSGSITHVPGADKRLTTQTTLHWWDPSGKRFLALEQGNFSKQAAVVEISTNGTLRDVVRESTDTFLLNRPLLEDEPAFRFLPRSNEAIWYSERDGWGHLYLVDIGTGAIKAKITNGEWSVQNIVRVDETTRRIYFTAVGREPGQDVYFRHLYSATFEGRDLRLLTPENADHQFPGAPDPVRAKVPGRDPVEPLPELISPSAKYVVDTYSTLTSEPVTVLKRIDGKTILALEKVDTSALLASGWLMPETFIAKAADGKTDLYGYIIKPPHFDQRHRYPVIDAIYGGPQVVTVSHDFVGGVGSMGDAEALAQLGFVVINVDARGTPLRSKAFHDYIYNNMQEFGLEDHVAVIKQMAARNAYMDLDRVGIFGHSFGGYTSLKGILGYPDFFKVSVSSSGPYDLFSLGYIWDGFFEPPRFKDGSSYPASPGDRPTNWGAIDLTKQVDRLKGHLMLAFADLDENARPELQVKLIDALMAANKTFDLIYMPGRNHYYMNEGYFVRRRWDFFVRYLLGADPPKDFRVDDKRIPVPESRGASAK
jgi:dipeptidyl-peptidase 4